VLKEWLTADHIQLCERVEDWRQAVTLSAQPLLQRGVITPNYLTAIFHQQEKLGPYFVLAPVLHPFAQLYMIGGQPLFQHVPLPSVDGFGR